MAVLDHDATALQDELQLYLDMKTADAEALRRGLSLAIDVIGNYRRDILDGIAAGIVQPGYCQGSIYRGAYRLIRHEMEAR